MKRLRGAEASARSDKARLSSRKRRTELFHMAHDDPPLEALPLPPPSTEAVPQLTVTRVLRDHFLFAGMTAENIDGIAQALHRKVARASEVVIAEGDRGDYLYLVEAGVLSVSQRDAPNVVDEIREGRVFGELALIYDSPRAATVTAVTTSTLWTLSAVDFRRLATRFMNENLQRRIAVLKKIPAFAGLSDEQLGRVSAVMCEERFAPGEQICHQGEKLVAGVNDKFYTITEGEVMVTAQGFSRKSSRDLLQAAAESSAAAAAAGDPKIVSLGNLGPGEWFGEIALLSDAPRSANVVALGSMGGRDAQGHTVCLTLSRGAFEQIISPSAAQRAIVGASEVRQQDNHAIKLRHQRDDAALALSMEKLALKQIIGIGGFSVVKFAVGPEHEAFAVKLMNKAEIVKRNQVVHVLNERRILTSISHPFVLSLIKTFQTPTQLVMVLELLQGGELFSRVLKSGGGLPLRDAAFYAACVVEGLEFLHRKHIVYRDLKLENVVIGASGYPKIVDFGFAKELGEGQLTRTLCGTPDYLAPEAITHKGHNQPVDCWGLGVLMYEMLTQYSPFADSTNKGNRMVVFHNIMRGLESVDWNELARPFRAALDRQASAGTLTNDVIRTVNEEFAQVQNLLQRLWDPNPLSRATTTHVKQHRFFQEWNWTALREMSVAAPWLPQLENAADLQYFDVEGLKDTAESALAYEGDQTMFAEFS